MARGNKKTIEEKILQKQDLINSLTIRLENEQKELEQLLHEQEKHEISCLYSFIKNNNLNVLETIKTLQQILEKQYDITA